MSSDDQPNTKPTSTLESINVPENKVDDIKNKQKKIEYLDNLEKNLKEAYDKVQR